MQACFVRHSYGKDVFDCYESRVKLLIPNKKAEYSRSRSETFILFEFRYNPTLWVVPFGWHTMKRRNKTKRNNGKYRFTRNKLLWPKTIFLVEMVSDAYVFACGHDVVCVELLLIHNKHVFLCGGWCHGTICANIVDVTAFSRSWRILYCSEWRIRLWIYESITCETDPYRIKWTANA